MKFTFRCIYVHYGLGLLIGIDSLCAASYEIHCVKHNVFRYVLITSCIKHYVFHY